MTPEQIDHVFGRGRLKMVTGEHVEVFREAVAPGERRRYTKRFLNTREGDFGQWTEREWRILARLIGHGIACVPDVVQFDRGRRGGMQLVQTYDAGVTVDQWATLLPVTRDGRVLRHAFEDCAHWWALAHHCLLALNVIHPLELVHLDIKGDNVCIPYTPASFDPDSSDLRLRPVFAQLALIDFAFALISRESLTTPLPLGWQKDYDYQSPRLLAALEAGRNGDLQLTRELDWRCDMYSLSAMLKRHLPEESFMLQAGGTAGWTAERYDAAKALILRIRDCHDSALPEERPHAALIEQSGARLSEPELALSLEREWTLAREASVSQAAASPLTPVTRLAPPGHVLRSGRITAVTVIAEAQSLPPETTPSGLSVATPRARQSRQARQVRGPIALVALIATCAVAATLWYAGGRSPAGEIRALAEPIRAAADHAGDTLRRLFRRDEQARGVGTVSAEAPATGATSKDPAPLRPPPAQAAAPHAIAPASAPDTALRDLSRPSILPPQPASPVIASTPDAVARATLSATQGPREKSPTVQPQHSITQAQGWAGTRSKSSTLAPVRQTTTPSQSTTKLGRAPSTRAPTASNAQNRWSTQARRAHASWVSLEPPAWLRGGPGPGEPPAVKTHEPRVARVASIERVSAVAASAAPAAATATRIELAQTSGQLDVTPPAAGSQPVSIGASTTSAEPPAATSAAGDPRSNVVAAPARQPSRSVSASAPVEDRSEGLKLALTPAPSAPEPASRATVEPSAQDDFAGQARRTLADVVPRIARQTEREATRVLLMAASAYHPQQERAVVEAARLSWIRGDLSLLPGATAPGEARRLNDQARVALASRHNLAEALDLQLRAFGANPRDPEVAGHLALLYLKLMPPQAETARQVALLALATYGAQQRSTRTEDWYTFAVSSALSGRDVDARNALFVMLAVSGNTERSCLAALNALARYGERLRGPVEAVFSRIHGQGRDDESPACAWPPNLSVLSKLP
jgi:serine/threonine protein kinase